MKELQKFSKIILYALTHKQESIVSSLKEFLDKSDTITFETISEYPILREKISNDCLIITSQDAANKNYDSRVYDLLYKRGVALSISCERFLVHSLAILKNRATACLGEVALLFLPIHLSGLLERIFILYGFKVQNIASFSQLAQLEKRDFIHLVFDQDLSGISPENPNRGSYREESIRRIKRVSAANADMSVFVVKNFQQGSLFDDVTSSVRSICNLLLSYEEYLVFIKYFLHFFSANNLIQIQKKVLESSSHSRYFHWNRLHNPKRAYSELLENACPLQSSSGYRQVGISIDDWIPLELNLLLLSWLDEYLTHSEESKHRASFRFIEPKVSKEPPSIKLSEELSKLNSISFQNNTVTPHFRSTMPNEPKSLEGGPT